MFNSNAQMHVRQESLPAALPATSLRRPAARNCLLGVIAGVFTTVWSTASAADALTDPDIWHGEWQAENTDFRLLVLPSGAQFDVEPLNPLNLGWQASGGLINGSSGTIEVRYQGVVAQVMVQLISPESAIVRSLSCQPDYHVICTLVRNQQARFIKIQ